MKEIISNLDFHVEFSCIECGTNYSLSQILYRCSKAGCDGLLDIKHNLSALKRNSSQQWRSHLESRLKNTSLPFSSGVWSQKEWVLPHIKDKDIISLGEGKTPLIPLSLWADDLGLAAVWLKQCGISSTGSFKDLGMTVLISHINSLLAEGITIRAVVCASTGDTSASLAAYAAYAGIPSIVILPSNRISTAQLVQPITCNSLVLSLNTDFDGCMKIVKELTQNKDFYLANSMNPLRLEGQKTMGIEVLQQLDWEVPDWFIIPGGNLGNVSALVSGMSLLFELGLIKKLPRVCVAQSSQANPLYLSFQKKFKSYEAVSAKKTLASAIQIGDPISYKRAIKALEKVNGVVEEASEEELANAAARVDRYGMFNDPHTGVALACLEKLCNKGIIQKDDSAVVVSTAHGLKFANSKIAYHEGKLELKAKYQNKALNLDANLETIQKSIEDIIS